MANLSGSERGRVLVYRTGVDYAGREVPTWAAHWEHPDHQDRPRDSIENLTSDAAGIIWGRARTDAVFVQVGDQYYWAGLGEREGIKSWAAGRLILARITDEPVEPESFEWAKGGDPVDTSGWTRVWRASVQDDETGSLLYTLENHSRAFYSLTEAVEAVEPYRPSMIEVRSDNRFFLLTPMLVEGDRATERDPQRLQ